MRYLLEASLCIAGAILVASGAHGRSTDQDPKPAQARTRAAPMDALAEAILALSPDAGNRGAPTLAMLQARQSPIQWRAGQMRAGDSKRRVGTLAGSDVTAAKSDPIPELTFDWVGEPGHPLGFDPVKAFRKKGFKVQALYCAEMASEGTNYFLVSAPGKRPGVLSVYAFDAPMAISSVYWTIGYRLDGKVPTLEEAQAEADLDVTTDCSRQTYGPVPQISYAAAVALTQNPGRTGAR